MRPLALLILVSFCAVAMSAPPSPPESLEGLRSCLFEMRQSSAKYHRWLPNEIFTMDRRLVWMDRGISVLEDDLATLEKHVAVESATSEGHVFTNAVAGCRLYQSQFEARAHLFLALMACLAALVAALTVRIISFTLPGSKGKKPHARHPERVPNPPSDRPNTAVR